MSATAEDKLVRLDGVPDGDYLHRLWSLLADGLESLDELERWVLHRVNGKTDGEVTFKLIGRLAVFVKSARDVVEAMSPPLDRIERSFDDLSNLARGEEVDLAMFDLRGQPQHDRETRWKDNISYALGIERYTGGFHPEHAALISSRMTETQGPSLTMIAGGLDGE